MLWDVKREARKSYHAWEPCTTRTEPCKQMRCVIYYRKENEEEKVKFYLKIKKLLSWKEKKKKKDSPHLVCHSNIVANIPCKTKNKCHECSSPADLSELPHDPTSSRAQQQSPYSLEQDSPPAAPNHSAAATAQIQCAGSWVVEAQQKCCPSSLPSISLINSFHSHLCYH